MKLKELLSGVIIGVLLAGGIFAVAEETLSVTPNQFKITVNGEEKKIEGYNINGSTYFKLRDIGSEVGFSVDFKEETIMIDTTVQETENIVNSSENSKYNYISIDGVEYISSPDAEEFIRKSTSRVWGLAYTLKDTWTNDSGSWCYLIRTEQDTKTNKRYDAESFEIPCVFIDGLPYLTRETFENEILARINAE